MFNLKRIYLIFHKIKIKNIVITILTIYLFYFSLYDGNRNRNSNKKKVMKHAILLLSSYGINYMNNFLAQFNNDRRFDIYIHIDGQSKIDVQNNKTITKSNIKYIKHSFKSKRFSIKMVDTMFELLIRANKTDNYDYFHFFSDSCYLIKTLNEFYEFFMQNSNKSYMNYNLEKYFLYKNHSYILYKGSQWMSLHNNIVQLLINNINLFLKYKEEIKNKTIIIKSGAPDELIIQNIIVHNICKRNPRNYNIINNNLRFIRWKTCKKVHCPNFLDIDNISEEEIKNIRKNYLVIRKINYKNDKAIDLINILKGNINIY